MPKNKTETEWFDTVLKKGTIADRLAAHTLLIHESRNWSSLNTLIEMVDPRKCRRQCVMAMTTLRELFLDSLNLSKKNCTITNDDDKQKVRFYYTKFVDQLSLVAFDNLEETRRKAIWVLSELLMKHVENKEYILEKLIDKVGDKIPKLAHTAGHLVEKSVNSEKPELRSKAIKYVQRFLKRPNQTPKARYYAISLLSRIKLVRGNTDVANDLVSTYLDLYITLYKENTLESKLMNALLVGINRAYPYTKLKTDVFEQHLQTLYKLVHSVNFRMRVVAMVLIKNIVTKRAQLMKVPIEDRFYNLVFGQLIEPSLQYSSRQEAFAGLLLETINDDTVLERKEAFIKRMLQVALNSQPEFAQLLLSTITKIKGYNTDLLVNNADDAKAKHESSEEDSDEDDDGRMNYTSSDNVDENGKPSVEAGWVHKRPTPSRENDLLARNPLRAVPKQLSELYFFRRYFDKDISKLASDIIGDAKLPTVEAK